MRSPKRVDWICVFSKSGMLLSSLYLAFGFCATCNSMELPGPPWVTSKLVAATGAVLSLVVLILEFKDSDRLQNVNEALLLLATLWGIVFVATTLAFGILPCQWCLVYWGFHALWFVRYLFSKGQNLRLAPAVLLVGFLYVAALFGTPAGVIIVQQAIPYNKVEGLKSGAQFPFRTDTEIVAIATDCSTCAKKALRDAVNYLVKKHHTVSVYIPETRPELLTTFSDVPCLRANDSVYEKLHLKRSSSPRLYFVQKNLVSGNKSPYEVMRG